jgi:PIN domain nuclease of toxin-antitoxin system
VKGNLLDTSAALIALTDHSKLTPKVRKAILAGPNLLSVISWWEVMLKSMKGNLNVGDPRVWWPDALDQLAATPLPLRPEHIAGIHELLPIHADPFDRVLISQATIEGLAFVTTDSTVQLYASAGFRVIA